MGQRRIKKKLKKYVERDEFMKLKAYYMKHRKDVDLNELLYEGGNSLLHLVCQQGQDHIAWYLLEKNANPMLQNDKGQVPLHYACLFALKDSHYAFYDLVQPLIEKCPLAVGVADNKGRTPRDLVKKIRKLLANKGAKVDEAGSGSDSEEDSGEESWESRLKKETEDEYAASWGKYEEDFTTEKENSENEDYETWSERMGDEMHRKRKQEYNRKHPGDTKRRKEEAQKAEEQEKLKRKLEREHLEYQARAKLSRLKRLAQEKSKYNLRCTEVFSGDSSTLSYSDIPWPTPAKWDKTVESFKEFLLCDIERKDVNIVKKYLKGQQVIWHPDRFQQKCGSRLKVDEKDRIMDRVKLISQLMNNIVSDLDS